MGSREATFSEVMPGPRTRITETKNVWGARLAKQWAILFLERQVWSSALEGAEETNRNERFQASISLSIPQALRSFHKWDVHGCCSFFAGPFNARIWGTSVGFTGGGKHQGSSTSIEYIEKVHNAMFCWSSSKVPQSWLTISGTSSSTFRNQFPWCCCPCHGGLSKICTSHNWCSLSPWQVFLSIPFFGLLGCSQEVACQKSF